MSSPSLKTATQPSVSESGMQKKHTSPEAQIAALREELAAARDEATQRAQAHEEELAVTHRRLSSVETALKKSLPYLHLPPPLEVVGPTDTVKQGETYLSQVRPHGMVEVRIIEEVGPDCWLVRRVGAEKARGQPLWRFRRQLFRRPSV